MSMTFWSQGRNLSQFKLAPVEWIGPDTPPSCCGFQIGVAAGGGYFLNQEKYIKGIVEARQVKGAETHPVPKILEGEDEENPSRETVRVVQGVGEMLWLSTRTRPDVCYATALIARLVHRRPAYALQLCQHLLRYVASTASLGLHYDGGSANGTLRVLVDTSLGPPHEGYRSVHGVAILMGHHLLQWASSRQSFVTLSTAQRESWLDVVKHFKMDNPLVRWSRSSRR